MQTVSYLANTGGMNLSQPDVNLPDTDAELILNMRPTATGSWSTSNVGYQRVNATALGGGQKIDGITSFTTSSGASKLIAVSGGTLYDVVSGSGQVTSIYSGLSPGARVRFVTFQGLLLLFNGVDLPLQWDGVNPPQTLNGWPPAIAGFSAGQPAFGTIFANRLCLAGDASNPSVVYLSALEDISQFTPGSDPNAAGLIHVSPGDGQKITGLKTLYLPLENTEVLVIFKQRSVYLLQGSDADTFTLQKLAEETGAVGPDAILPLGNALMFLSEVGMMALSTDQAQTQGSLQRGLISKKIQPLTQRLNPARLSESLAVYDPVENTVWWWVPDGSANQNNRVLLQHMGLSASGTSCWSLREGMSARCGVWHNGFLYTGDYNGFVCAQQQGTSYANEPINWMYRTPFYALTKPGSRRRVREVQLLCRQIAPVTMSVDSAWNYQRSASRRHRQMVHVQTDDASAVYGSARFEANSYNESGTSMVRFSPPGSGHSLQLTFSGSVASPAVEIQGWHISTR
jgi:hypothetical protein